MSNKFGFKGLDLLVDRNFDIDIFFIVVVEGYCFDGVDLCI